MKTRREKNFSPTYIILHKKQHQWSSITKGQLHGCPASNFNSVFNPYFSSLHVDKKVLPLFRYKDLTELN